MSIIKIIENINSSEFQEAIQIYTSSFPIEERHSIEVISERIKSGIEKLYLLVKDDKIIGISMIWDLNYNNYFVLDYFAIKSDYRNNGYGALFLDELIKRYNDLNVKIIIEIEDYITYEVNDIKYKRAKFYKNLGFKEIHDYKYIMPSITGKPEVEMVLMVSNTAEIMINKDELKKLVSSIYSQLYYLDKSINFYQNQLQKINNDYKLL